MARKEQSLFSFDSGVEDEMANSGLIGYGNRQEDLNDNGFMKLKIVELGKGDTYEGVPELTVFFNDDKTTKEGKPVNYASLRLRLWDENNKELLDVYSNIPKVHDGMVKAPIRKGDKFFRGGFDLIFSFYQNVGVPIDPKTNKFENVNLLQIIDHINDEISEMEIKVIEGHPKDTRNSIEIVKME